MRHGGDWALVTGTALLAAAVLLAQISIGLAGVRANERVEGHRLQTLAADSASNTVTVTIKLLDLNRAARAILLVDGSPAGTFASGAVSVKVRAGQLLEIDCQAYGRELRFAVVGATGGTLAPLAGQVVTARGGIALLGRVIRPKP